MTKSEAQIAIKNLYSEALSLEPSVLVQLFEIDVSVMGFQRGVISQTEINNSTNTIFRFHNALKLTNSSIFWQGKEFVAAPIQAEGFEINSKGTPPTPKLAMTVSEEGIPALAQLKQRLLELGDLSGAKVTRIRTFAKYLDAENFYGTTPPPGFSPNPNVEFPRDVYYIDRKSNENKFNIEYELGSILDVGAVKLPARLVVSNTCPFAYRGEGCCYEFSERRIVEQHGEENDSALPTSAPPVANEYDEKITEILETNNLIDKGEYNPNIVYNKGDYVYITHNNLNYYFVAKNNGTTTSPPNLNYWIPDQCSKKVRGCEIRYALGGTAQGVVLGNLPYGGWVAVNRFK